MMKKIALVVLLTGLCVASAYAATPSSATLSVTARQVQIAGTPLLMNITHAFNTKPSSRCIVRLYGKLSATDGSSSGTTVRLMTKSSASRRVKFSYRGPSARVSAGIQKQLNFQTVSTCSGTKLYSTVAAANVTCTKGVADTSFVKLVRDRIRGVFSHRTAANSSESC